MMGSARAGRVFVLMGMVACQAPVPPPEMPPEVPAVIVNATPQSRMKLADAVSELLGGSPVILADDALTRSSVLLIERRPARDASGVRINGRDYGKAETFTLIMSGSACVLVSARNGRRITLTDITCRTVSN